MQKPALRVFTFSLGMLAAAPALAADDNQIWPAEVTIPNTRQIAFTSVIDGEPYTLSVSIPFIPPPAGGYPVYYVLDGEAYFSTAAVGSMLLQENAVVVVGIDHHTLNSRAVVEKYSGRKSSDTSPIEMDAISDAYNKLRRHDFTSTVAPNHRAPAWFELVDNGGVDDFLKIIEAEIKPKIAALVPVDTANQALYGHSLGGLAVVHALFTEPTAFRTFIASSPSLWWDADAVLKDEANFAATIAAGKAAPRILITAGGDEADSTIPPKAFLDSLPPDKQAEIAPYWKMRAGWSGMISGTRDLAERLAKLPGAKGYTVEYARMAGEDHPTAALVSVGRGLRFAFGGARFKFEK
jgi:predicted alpha/beta superfamily hydrolase